MPTNIIKKLLPILAAAFLLAPLEIQFLTGFAVAQSEDYGDAIVTGSIGDARTLVPILASDSASGDICSLLFNGLVKYDKDLNLVGDLAERWEIKEDGLVIIFYLRKNVRWHDGVPFTARDAEFTYKKLIDPSVKTPYSGDFERVKTFEVLDDYTIKLTYKEPFAPALSSWGMAVMPRHLLENEDLNKTNFSRCPIGLGPYKFKLWKTAERIDLESNHDYFEGRPYINRYIYRIIPDQSTMFLELLSGGVDFMGLTPLQFTRQTDTRRFKNNFQKFRYPSFAYTYIGYNFSNPKFKDKKVRQAINYAIDKNEIIDGVLLGLGRVANGPFPLESWACDKTLKPAAYDPALAKQLLKEAGWSDTDSDGWLEKQNEEFEFTLITNQGNDQRKQAAEIIQRRLKQVGIRVKIKIVEWSAFLSEFIDKRNFDAVLLGWSLSREPDPYDIWHSSKTKQGEFNFIGYKNKELDKLLDEGRRVFEQNKRAGIYHKIQRILYDEQPYCFLYVPDATPCVNKRFRGIKVAPAGIGYNFIKWYVPKNEQKYLR
ncbi:MAG: peptide-binding protein [Candidatus Omnitrophota bacterium]